MISTLRLRLTITMIVMAILPALTISVFIANQGFTRLRDETLITQQLTVVNAIQANISEYVEEHVTALTILDGSVNFSGMNNPDRKNGILTNLLAQVETFQNIYLMSLEGDEQFAAKRIIWGAGIPEDIQIAAMANNGVYFSPIHYDAIIDEPLITIGVPLLDSDTGLVSEFILADIRFIPVSNILSELNFALGQTAYLIDNNTQLVAHSDESVQSEEVTFNVPASNGITQGLFDERVVIGSDTITFGEQELTIVVEQNFRDANRLFTNLQNFTISSIGIISTFAIIAATVIAQRITEPIQELNDITQAYTRGDLSQRAIINSRDEVAQLSSNFNNMANAIQQREIALREARNEALESKHIADENSRLKSEFLAMMSHELRTPLNAIQGFTGIILGKMAGVEYNEKTGEYLERIESNGERLLELINDFLDLSRIESGRLQLAHFPISPYKMANRWENNFSVLAHNKDLDFELFVDPNLPKTIYGDEESLSKIVINLIGNAIKFTSEGKIKLSLQKQDENMLIIVKDTGVGIPPHAREFIFEEFRQVDMSTRREYGGTGLGLSIVQKLVREMKGFVNLESEVGVGSTFTVKLPISIEAKDLDLI